MTARLSEKKLFALVCLVLAFGTAALYWPITHHQFIIFDDDEYVAANNHVLTGLNWTNAVWAFDGAHAANWHPLTWISHQADGSVFGADPGGHHLVNLLFHVANTLLLFLFLRGTTGALWRSAFVAALFAWHPLHVESVAWASERKDVLSAFFWLLTLLAYAKYVMSDQRRVTSTVPTPSLVTRHSSLWFYLLSLAFFALGLMSKPMVVTLPFVLLLLDVWPLRRISDFRFSLAVFPVRLFAEKIPFFALSLGGCLLTMHAQGSAGAISPMAWPSRLMNALLAYPRYIAKLFWPADLSIIYPYRYDWPAAALIGAALLLLAISVLAVKYIRAAPWVFVGWFWFLGTLVPTIGIIQVGAAAVADRYSYLPSIGFFCMLVWTAVEFCPAGPRAKNILSLLGVGLLLGCLAATTLQISYWRDSVSLFLHSLEVTENNYVTDNCLGIAFDKAGDKARALVLYREAVRLEPRYPQSQFNLAISLIGFGQMEEALQHLQTAAELEPGNPDVQFDLGIYFSQHGSLTNAVNCFRNAVSARPHFAAAERSLAAALVKFGRFAEAAPHYRQALQWQPDLAGAKTELADLLAAHPELR
jgi:Flp pilus assembly protein TadD